MKTLRDIGDLNGKKVIARLGLNVPIENGQIIDDYRIQKMLPTLKFLTDGGARVIVVAHIGRDKKETLKPVAEYLGHTFNVTFVSDIMSQQARDAVESSAPGDVVFFENLRRWDGEANNDPTFVEHLASFADVYVNDAFPVAHRSHASITGLPTKLPAYAGMQFEQEVTHLEKAFDPNHPFVFILGGAKVETKLPLLQSILPKADTVFVGGVLANDFFKAQGKPIGKSIVSDTVAPLDMMDNRAFTLPHDVVVLRNGEHVVTNVDAVEASDQIFDAGPESIQQLAEAIRDARLVVWNGPVGLCEKGFCDGTIRIAQALARSEACTIAGGGDSLAAIPDDLQDQFDFVSTGGGAMLDFLSDGTLPAIEALENSI